MYVRLTYIHFHWGILHQSAFEFDTISDRNVPQGRIGKEGSLDEK